MYTYALNETKEIVHIKDATEDMKESTRFFCISCGDEMVARMSHQEPLLRAYLHNSSRTYS